MEEEEKSRRDYIAYKHRQPTGRPRKVSSCDRDREIAHLTEEFDLGVLSLRDFLSQASNFFDPAPVSN